MGWLRLTFFLTFPIYDAIIYMKKVKIKKGVYSYE